MLTQEINDRLTRVGPGTPMGTGHPILFPYILLQGTGTSFSYQIRVPVDDTNTLHMVYTGRSAGRAAPAGGGAIGAASPSGRAAPLVARDGVVVPVTRRMPEYDALGLVDAPGIGPQDHMAWISQGPISNRTLEHLVTSDKGVILYRNLLLEQIEKVERGEDPMGTVRDPDLNEPYIHIRHEEKGYTQFRINRELAQPTIL